MENKKPVDAEQTIFRAASVSKTFTATAVMQLVEQGKLELNRDITGYIGGLDYTNKTGTSLTLKHLMTHSSGLASGEGAEYGDFALDHRYPLADYMKDLTLTVAKPPGEAYSYNNIGFSLQGYIVEKVSGEQYGDYTQKHIFQPLGMESSSFTLTPDKLSRLAVPYNTRMQAGSQYPNVPDSAPSGGLLTTGADMARFMLAQLNGGVYGKATILKAASVEDMQRSSFSIHPQIAGAGYGFESTYPQDYNGRDVIGKLGDLQGFHSAMWLLPKERTGIFISYNKDGADLRHMFFKAFMDRYFPLQQTEQTVPIPKTPTEELKKYEGLYNDLRLSAWIYNVAATDGKLIVTDTYGTHTLSRIKGHLFVDENNLKAAFKEDSSGKIAYFSYNKPDSWSAKLPAVEPFSDVPEGTAYAEAINALKQLGVLPGEGQFEPEQSLTRGEFVGWFIRMIGPPRSAKPSVFKDTADSPYAVEIQTALELGLIQGSGSGMFNPDLPITRQQAASIVWRAAHNLLGIPETKASLAGQTDAWAVPGVSFVITAGIYGPEVKQNTDGAFDYQSKQLMLRQEAVVLMYKLLFRIM